MLEPFDFRSPFSDSKGILTGWASRWMNQLTAQVNSILHLIGIKSLNGDTTPAQTLIAGANVTITDDGKGKHTIAAGEVVAGIQSINGDTAHAQKLVNGSYIQIAELGGGKHSISCTLTPGGGATLYGQFADDTAAAAGGVPIGGMYYLPGSPAYVVVRTT